MREYMILDGNKTRKDGLTNYSYGALISDPYGVQNVIMREVGMDQYSRPDVSWDSDRVLMWEYDGFRSLCKEVFGLGELGIGQWAKGASAKNLLSFAEKLYALVEKKECKATGFRVIRNTNVSSGYPIYTLQIVIKK